VRANQSIRIAQSVLPVFAEGNRVVDNTKGRNACLDGINGWLPSPILVVDDDAVIRRVIRDALEGEGFSVTTSADAFEALAVASRLQPSIVILDVHLPDMRGEVVAKTLNARSPGKIQFITISGDETTAESARAMQAVAYLRKPFDIDDLIQVVQGLATRGRSTPPR
jgi:two-component system KDP operon response regulator KdpE